MFVCLPLLMVAERPSLRLALVAPRLPVSRPIELHVSLSLKLILAGKRLAQLSKDLVSIGRAGCLGSFTVPLHPQHSTSVGLSIEGSHKLGLRSPMGASGVADKGPPMWRSSRDYTSAASLALANKRDQDEFERVNKDRLAKDDIRKQREYSEKKEIEEGKKKVEKKGDKRKRGEGDKGEEEEG